MPKTTLLIFNIDGHEIVTTEKTLSLPGHCDVIGFFFEPRGHIHKVLRKSAYGELLLKAASERQASE